MKRGSKTAKRAAMLTAAFCICSSVAWDSTSARSDNSVTSLNYSQESARTLVEIGVKSDPTFSVYTLKNPERVVVEILDCDSSSRVSPVQVRNGVIDTAAVSVSQSNDYSTCRVILGLEKEASYNIDSSKDRITVAVDGKPAANATALAASVKQQEEALASARSIVEREQAAARQAREEANAARQEAILATERGQIAAEKAREEANAARQEANAARQEALLAAEREQLATEQARIASEREKSALAQLDRAYREAQNRVNEVEAQLRAAQSDSAQNTASVQDELIKAQNNVAALELARKDAIARAQAAEAQRDLAQAQAKESLLREQQTIAKLQKEQEVAKQAAQAQADANAAQLAAERKGFENTKASLVAANAELTAENEQLKAQVQAATTASAQAAHAEIATTAPIDTSIVAANTQTKTTAVAPIDDQAAAHASVRDIQFRKQANGDGMQVVLKMSAPVAKVENIDAGNAKSVLRIAGAVLPDNFNKKFDTSAFNQGIKFVDSTQTKGGIELIAQSSARTIDSIEQNGDTITWNIRPLRDASGSYKAPVDRRSNAMISAAEPSPMPSNAYGAISNLRDTPLAKRKITLDIHDADINDLLRLLSDEINTSIVVSPDVSGKITLSLKSVPLDQALDIILRMHDLGMRYEGSVIWVAKAAKFRAEEERAIQAAEVRERLEPLEVRLIPVNYALADELSDNVSSLLSSRGTVNIDKRTNTLILKDVAANLDAAEILVSNLDTQTPQILIEARIVETQANFTKQIGIQWGGDGVASAATGNATGIVFPSTIGIAGGSTSDNNSGTSATPNFAVNLPASVGTGSGGALGITLGSLGGLINLNIRLSSLEEKGYLKIVSAPRIMTLDNVQASIESGTSVPISVVSAAGAQTVFYDAKLNLQVTPHVTRDGNVYLKIDITKNEPDFGNTGASGDPSIVRKEAHTELLIPDGNTTVIGGIYSRNTSQSMSSVPFWGSIPILGYLFRNTSEQDNRSELLIFITPRIINRDASISASGQGSFIPPVERSSEDSKK